MDPCENCIDLSPVTGTILPSYSSFLDSSGRRPESSLLYPHLLGGVGFGWFCLGQESKAVPPAASGGVREPRVGNKAIPIACPAREEKITSS